MKHPVKFDAIRNIIHDHEIYLFDKIDKLKEIISAKVFNSDEDFLKSIQKLISLPDRIPVVCDVLNVIKSEEDQLRVEILKPTYLIEFINFSFGLIDENYEMLKLRNAIIEKHLEYLHDLKGFRKYAESLERMRQSNKNYKVTNVDYAEEKEIPKDCSVFKTPISQGWQGFVRKLFKQFEKGHDYTPTFRRNVRQLNNDEKKKCCFVDSHNGYIWTYDNFKKPLSTKMQRGKRRNK